MIRISEYTPTHLPLCGVITRAHVVLGSFLIALMSLLCFLVLPRALWVLKPKPVYDVLHDEHVQGGGDVLTRTKYFP